MKRTERNTKAKIALRMALLASSVMVATPALAQLSTSTVRGTVTLEAGQIAPETTVRAVNVDTGYTKSVRTGANGNYVLSGLQPGNYRITATTQDGKQIAHEIQVQVGQTADVDLALSEVTESIENIIVVGRVVENKTSEIATNITVEQIENLPQNNRNFLNFAGLAPGVRVSTNELRQTFSGGGISSDPNGEPLGSPQVNVFIDGVSLKSNIQQGGIVGQDASRGNPFPQGAVQEFRVLTQNFKAEYENAGTSIITAVTKSGTNEFEGEAFGFFQPTSFTEKDFFVKEREDEKPKRDRYQAGLSLGGPIVKDKLHFFVTYEANIQNRAFAVVPGGDAERQAQVPFDVDSLNGTFTSPFREHLGFGKLSWQVDDRQYIEVSGSVRKESDVRDFGGQEALSRARRASNDTYIANLKHQYTGDSFFNEASFDYLESTLDFGTRTSDEFGRIFQGVINVGGRADTQNVVQRGFTIRDNLSLTDVEWNGDHLIKTGFKVSFQKYNIGGSGPFANPQFTFRIDQDQGFDFTTPELVDFGVGDPNIQANNVQLGFFIQDDWEVNSRLTLNLGLRWDFETNAKNNNFVTSPAAAEALRALGENPNTLAAFNAEDYISTGENRDPGFDQFQPRFGFSYDVFDDEHTVIFGGLGRYYDRAIFRNAAEESLLRQFARGQILFDSPTGQPRSDGRATIPFLSEYLTPEGFANLLASIQDNPSIPGTTELRVIPNDLKSPYTDQVSFGVRQKVWDFNTSLSYSFIRGRNQIGYFPANRSESINDAGFRDFIPLINGFSNVVAASNERASRFHGVYFTADKPYTEASGWGIGINYTLAFSKERGFPFNFDHPDIAAEPFRPNAGDERHRLVVNAIAGLPFGIKASTLTTLASGQPFFVIDASEGFGENVVLSNEGDAKTFFQIDLRLAKTFDLPGRHKIEVIGEVFNLFNRANFGGYDGFIPPSPGVNENFGAPNALAGPPRSFQLGVKYKF